MIAMLMSFFKPFTVLLFLASIIAIGVGGSGLPVVWKFFLNSTGTMEDQLTVLHEVLFFATCLSFGISGLVVSGCYAIMLHISDNMRIVANAVSRPKKPKGSTRKRPAAPKPT